MAFLNSSSFTGQNSGSNSSSPLSQYMDDTAYYGHKGRRNFFDKDGPLASQQNKLRHTDLLKNSADISREQFDVWRKNYLPMQFQVLDRARDQSFLGDYVEGARQDSIKAGNVARENRSAQLRRYGLQSSGDQQSSLSRRDAFDAATSETAAANQADVLGQDLRDSWIDTAINEGRWIQGQAASLGAETGRAGAEGYRNQLAIEANRDAAKMGMIGSGIGMVGGMMMMSSKDTKERIKDLKPEKSYGVLKGIDVKEWQYKGDNQRTAGGIAEDMPSEVLSKDGKKVNVASQVGHLVNAVKHLGDKVEKLEGRKNG